MFGFFSFMTDFLHRVSGMSFDGASAVLLGYGAANIAGNLLAGRFYSERSGRWKAVLPAALGTGYLLLFAAGSAAFTAGAVILLLGVLAGFASVAGQSMITSAAPEAPDFANGLFLTAAVLAGTVALEAGCGGSSDTKSEGGQNLKGKKLVMYVSFHEDTAKELADQFKQKTGADVSFIRLPTGEALARITAEKDSPKADIWLGGTSDAHAKAKADGLTEAYKSPNAKMIKPEYQDKDGYWYGTYLEIMSIGYNEARFKQEFEPKGIKAPETLEDLLNPAFKGEIIAPDPRKSGTGLTFISSVLQSQGEEKGWDYLLKLKDQVAQFTPSGFAPAQKTGAGEYLIALNFISDQMLVSQKGQKIHSTIYKDAGWTLCPVSIIKNSADKEVAQAFVDYCLTKEAGEILVRTTNGVACNPDVAPPKGQKPLTELPLYNAYDMEKAGADKDANCAKFFGE